MRTSLTEIRDIEKYLFDELPPGDTLVFEARILTDDRLKSRIGLQQKLYSLLTLYQRKKAKEKVLRIHDELFSAGRTGAFRNSIEQIFN